MIVLHLAAGATAKLEGGSCLVESGGRRFSLTWSEGWEAALREGWESRRYGVREARRVLELRRQGRLLSLAMALTSASETGGSWVIRPRAPCPMISRVALTVGSRFALTALSLVSSIITARVLGEAGRGNYFFIVTLSATIVQSTIFGQPMSAMYYVAADPKAVPSLVANAFWISLLGAAGRASRSR